MKEIVQHVDSLFADCIMNSKNKELREEIISNLEAKVNDYISEGMDRSEAIDLAVKDVGNIDHLIDGNKEIYIYRYTTEVIQIALLYLVISWIITIPLILIPDGGGVNGNLSVLALIVAAVYIIRLRKKDESIINKAGFIKAEKLKLFAKGIWFLWGFFLMIDILFITAVAFGSNIWFSRPIRIDGPYQFAILATRYIKPFVTISIPLLASKASKIIDRYEVRD